MTLLTRMTFALLEEMFAPWLCQVWDNGWYVFQQQVSGMILGNPYTYW